MSVSFLSLIVFVLVFAAVVLIHEFGHFIVARLFKIEVEEFGFGLPPRLLTLYRQKGYLVLKSGKRIEIPADIGLPLPWSGLIGRVIPITVQQVNEQWVLRTLDITALLQEMSAPATHPLKEKNILVDERGQVVPGKTAPKPVVIGKQVGEIALNEEIAEVHAGTEFTLNALPLGGFVRPKGENDPAIAGGLAAANPWARLGVLLAGPAMNLLAGVVVFSLLFYQIGIPDFKQVEISQVLPGSPAAQAGLQAGDLVVQANGQKITSTTQLHDIIYSNLDRPIDLVVRRGEQTVNLTAIPSSARTADQGALGISMSPLMVKSPSFWSAIPVGAREVYEQARLLLSLPAQMLRGTIAPQEGRFVGLKGIYDMFNKAVSRDVESRAAPVSPSSSTPPLPQRPSFFTLQLIGILTVSIGIFNLLPIPALDGGRILFVLPELLFRRRVSPKMENLVHGIGMALLLLFMLYVNIMDFINPVQLP